MFSFFVDESSFIIVVASSLGVVMFDIENFV